MPKDRGRNDERSRIAHLAARMIAEDGVADYAAAKRKAKGRGKPDDTPEIVVRAEPPAPGKGKKAPPPRPEELAKHPAAARGPV